MDNDRRLHLNRHVQAQLLSVTTAGLYDVDDETAHMYLDTANALLLETLAEADPWRDLHGMDDRTIDGDRFGHPEAFADILHPGPVMKAAQDFGEVNRDPLSLEEKNRLFAWLALRHRIIATWCGRFDEVYAIAEQASRIASGLNSDFTRRQMIALHQIEDDEYFYARNLIHSV